LLLSQASACGPQSTYPSASDGEPDTDTDTAALSDQMHVELSGVVATLSRAAASAAERATEGSLAVAAAEVTHQRRDRPALVVLAPVHADGGGAETAMLQLRGRVLRSSVELEASFCDASVRSCTVICLGVLRGYSGGTPGVPPSPSLGRGCRSVSLALLRSFGGRRAAAAAAAHAARMHPFGGAGSCWVCHACSARAQHSHLRRCASA
jgi:hypothetical protein